MKAWWVSDRWERDFGTEVVFAETRGKAVVIAQGLDNFQDSEFMDLRATRVKDYDKYYKPGKTHMDWNIDEDRIVLAQNGCHCHPDYVDYEDDCPFCCAKDVCDLYQEYLEEYKEEENV